MSLSIDEFDEPMHQRLAMDNELTSSSKLQSLMVYFKDGTRIEVLDGFTWEYEQDPNWLKTVPTIDAIMDFFKKTITKLESHGS